MLLGNPLLSGLTSAPELLPTGWGTVGQLLPPGAAGLVPLGAGALVARRRRPAPHPVRGAVPA